MAMYGVLYMTIYSVLHMAIDGVLYMVLLLSWPSEEQINTKSYAPSITVSISRSQTTPPYKVLCLLQGGLYWFNILDTYSAGHALLIIVLCEVIGIVYVYGKCTFMITVCLW